MNKPGIYAVGDVQGCLQPLCRLIEKSPIDLSADQLWFAGDLINRGPHSLETLRHIKGLSAQMGERLKIVLGNHDLHLLALAYGVSERFLTPGIEEILKADDCDELLEWLRNQPLLVKDTASRLVLTHAGIYPGWEVEQAAGYAREVEALLQGDEPAMLLKNMYGNQPSCWVDELEGWSRHRFIINSMTRMRFCMPNGELDFDYDCSPGKQPAVLSPWYRLPQACGDSWRIVFGHWSYAGAWQKGVHVALDSGCVYGEKMTMARIDLQEAVLYQTECKSDRLLGEGLINSG